MPLVFGPGICNHNTSDFLFFPAPYPYNILPKHPVAPLNIPFTENPELQIPGTAVTALSGYWLWCTAKGTPPIQITITDKNGQDLVESTGFAKIRVYDEGTYKCNARNKAGMVSKEMHVTLLTSMFLDVFNLFVIYLFCNVPFNDRLKKTFREL